MKSSTIRLIVVAIIAWVCSGIDNGRGVAAKRDRESTGIILETGNLEAAFIGDSISTGAATHPKIRYDPDRYWEIVTGNIVLSPTSNVDQQGAVDSDRGVLWASPRRLWPSYRSFMGGEFWLISNVLNAIGRLYVDTEEYGWPSILARRQGWSMSSVAVAAENGARIEDISRQYDRVLDHTRGRSPRRLFVYFTGNDLCAQGFEQLTTEEEFENNLKKGLAYIYRNGRIPRGGLDIYVPDYLGVVQLLTKPSIQSKEITAFNETTTCKKLRRDRFLPSADYSPTRIPTEASYFAKVLPLNLANYCPTLFGAPGFGMDDHDRVSALANRIRSYRRATSDAIAATRKIASKHWSNREVRFHQVNGTGKLQFEDVDIANDCFHLSYHGQRQIADAVADALSAITQNED